MEEMQDHPRAEASIDQGGVRDASPVKQQRGPLIICCVLAFILAGAVVTFAMFSNKENDSDSSDVEVVAEDDVLTEDDLSDLLAWSNRLDIEITDDTTFADIANAMKTAGIADSEDVDFDESDWKIADDYCGDAECKDIDVEFDEHFFDSYTNSAAGVILDTVYEYFAGVYPEYSSITYLKDSWYGNTFKIKTDDGALFEINVATQLSKYNSLLNVTKVSIFTSSKQQVFVRDIFPSDDPDLNLPVSFEMSDNEWGEFDTIVNDIGDDE